MPRSQLSVSTECQHHGDMIRMVHLHPEITGRDLAEQVRQHRTGAIGAGGVRPMSTCAAAGGAQFVCTLDLSRSALGRKVRIRCGGQLGMQRSQTLTDVPEAVWPGPGVPLPGGGETEDARRRLPDAPGGTGPAAPVPPIAPNRCRASAGRCRACVQSSLFPEQ